ncbi:MAG: hypothetical protein M3Q29_08805 [Chloroflexota bacterium]|nr:hypothetical protein [Chloroflexota bacterium]
MALAVSLLRRGAAAAAGTVAAEEVEVDARVAVAVGVGEGATAPVVAEGAPDAAACIVPVDT